MNTKMTSAIEKITLNAATFSAVSVEPTLINFFYGNNGTGKSTIAREILADSGLAWQQGKSADDYSVLGYNQEFVEANFKGYGNLKGVFTIGTQNDKVQADIDKKTAKRAEQDKFNSENTSAKEHKEAQRTALLNDFQKTCWDKTKTIRAEFSETQKGYKTPISKFVDYVLQLGNPVHTILEN